MGAFNPDISALCPYIPSYLGFHNISCTSHSLLTAHFIMNQHSIAVEQDFLPLLLSIIENANLAFCRHLGDAI